MSTPDDLTAGMELARDAILAVADDDKERALALLSAATHAEVGWAAATLLGHLAAVFLPRAKGDRRRAAILLRRAAAELDQDIVRAHIKLLTKEA